MPRGSSRKLRGLKTKPVSVSASRHSGTELFVFSGSTSRVFVFHVMTMRRRAPIAGYSNNKSPQSHRIAAPLGDLRAGAVLHQGGTFYYRFTAETAEKAGRSSADTIEVSDSNGRPTVRRARIVLHGRRTWFETRPDFAKILSPWRKPMTAIKGGHHPRGASRKYIG
jgi:hypothetical protein